MRNGLGKWMKQAIEETVGEQDADMGIIKLQELEKKFPGETLADILDRGNIKVLAQLSGTQLEKMEQLFPGVIDRIPFREALMAGNLYLLGKKRDQYFAQGWEKTVADLLFLDNEKSVDVRRRMKNVKFFSYLRKDLEWILADRGYLPEIDGIEELCSKAECLLCEQNGCSQEDAGQIRADIERLRVLTKKHRFLLRNMGSSFCATDVDFSRYESVVIDLKTCEGMWENLMAAVKSCHLENVVFQNTQVLSEKELIEYILAECRYDDSLQEKFCRIFEQYGNIKDLYQKIDTACSVEAYGTIVSWYFSAEEQKDELLQVNEEKEGEA